METSLLWYQPAKLNDQDVIIFNGERVEDTLQRAEHFSLIKNEAALVLKKQKPWCGKIRNFFFMKGNLEMKDELGRTMSFMYLTDLPNPKDALKNELENAGISLSASSEKCLLKQGRLTAGQIMLLSFAVLIIVAFIVYSLKYRN